MEDIKEFIGFCNTKVSEILTRAKVYITNYPAVCSTELGKADIMVQREIRIQWVTGGL